jgi:hypothetical protein
VCVNAVEPGWVRTAQSKQVGPYWLFNFLGRVAQTSPEQCATSLARAATAADPAGVGGRFLDAGGR